MGKVLLLFSTFLLGSVFLFLPRTLEPYDYFLFSDMKLYFATHLYFIVERIILIILAYIIVNESTEYRSALWVFFWILCADLVDYLLCYNETWINFNGIPISMQVLKIVIFGGAILRELWKR